MRSTSGKKGGSFRGKAEVMSAKVNMMMHSSAKPEGNSCVPTVFECDLLA